MNYLWGSTQFQTSQHFWSLNAHYSKLDELDNFAYLRVTVKGEKKRKEKKKKKKKKKNNSEAIKKQYERIIYEFDMQ
jgi:hypothetical protein